MRNVKTLLSSPIGYGHLMRASTSKHIFILAEPETQPSKDTGQSPTGETAKSQKFQKSGQSPIHDRSRILGRGRQETRLRSSWAEPDVVPSPSRCLKDGVACARYASQLAFQFEAEFTD